MYIKTNHNHQPYNQHISTTDILSVNDTFNTQIITNVEFDETYTRMNRVCVSCHLFAISIYVYI